MTERKHLAERLRAALEARGEAPVRLRAGDQDLEVLWSGQEAEGVRLVYTTGARDAEGDLQVFAGLYGPDGQLIPSAFQEAARVLERLEEELRAPRSAGPLVWPEEDSGVIPVEEAEAAFFRPQEPAPLEKPPASQAEALLAEAQALEKAGKCLEAARRFQAALATGRIRGGLCQELEYTCGRLYREAGQPETAFAFLQKAAQAGHTDAMLACGTMRQNGEGAAVSAEEAFLWFKRAAEQGHAQAQAALASMYSLGAAPGGRDKEEALHWYEMAAKQGNADAQYRAGLQHMRGEGTSISAARAMQWLEAAAAQGHGKAALECARLCLKRRDACGDPAMEARGLALLQQAVQQEIPEACTDYGALLFNGGYGREADRTAAIPWFTKAAQKGDVRAEYTLGMIFVRGTPEIPKDFDAAYRWFARAAERNHPDALFQTAECLRLGRGVGRKPAEALAYYQKAIAKKTRFFSSACFWCGALYHDGLEGIQRDYAKALQYFQKAEAAGHTTAARVVGEMYYYGRGVRQDFEKALQQFSKATGKQDAAAAYFLGRMHSLGQGTAADKPKAFQFYDQAAKLGHKLSGGQCAAMCFSGDGVKKNQALAFQYAEPAAQDAAGSPGDALAQYICGFLYYHGFRGMAKNRAKAAEYLRRSADQGQMNAQTLYASMLLRGKDIPSDEAAAVRYLQMAARQGDAAAVRFLKIFGNS